MLMLMLMAMQRDGDGALVPLRRTNGPGVDEDPAVREWAQPLVVQARADGLELTGDGGLLTGLVKQVLQAGLQVEMVGHLDNSPHDPAGPGSGNSHNGSYPKTVTTEVGQVELALPRDRSGTFEPVTVPKYQRQLDGLAGNVIALYARG